MHSFAGTMLLPTADAEFRLRHPPRRAELNGQPWEYWASGEGRTGLLMLGGELAFGDCMHRLINQFEHGYRVISPSWPAVGTIGELLEGLLALLDHEGLKHVAVFGHAFGAGVAHALARIAPERIDTLALSGFGLCSGLHAFELRAQAAAFKVLPYASVRSHYERIFDRLAADAGQRSDELLAVAERLMSRHTHQSALLRHALMAELYGHPERYGLQLKVETPAHVLLLFANDDHVFSRDEQAALAKTYAAPTVTRYLNGGHWVGLLPAQEFERKLSLHFSRHSVPTAHSLPRLEPVLSTSSQASLDADTLEWRQDRRLG